VAGKSPDNLGIFRQISGIPHILRGFFRPFLFSIFLLNNRAITSFKRYESRPIMDSGKLKRNSDRDSCGGEAAAHITIA
jgi:hypothetical protein